MSATTTPRTDAVREQLSEGQDCNWLLDQYELLELELTAKTAELEEAKETIRSVSQAAHDHALNYRKANVRIAELEKEVRSTHAAALEEAAEIAWRRMAMSTDLELRAKAASVREGKG